MLGSNNNRLLLVVRAALYFVAGLGAMVGLYFANRKIGTEIFRSIWALVIVLIYVGVHANVSLSANRKATPVRLGLALAEVISVLILIATSGGGHSHIKALAFFAMLFVTLEHGGLIGLLAAIPCTAGWVWLHSAGPYYALEWAGGIFVLGFFGFLLEAIIPKEAVSEGRLDTAVVDKAHRIARQQTRAKERSEQELFEERRRFVSLVEVAQGLASARQQDDLLAAIVRVAREQLDVGGAAVLLAEKDTLRAAGGSGLSHTTLSALEGKLKGCFMGRVLLKGEPLSYSRESGVEELMKFGADGAFQELLGLKERKGQSAYTGHFERINNFSVVPLRTPQDKVPFGLLLVANLRARERFSALEEGYLKILATNAAVGLKNLYFTDEIERSHFELIQALAQAIEAKDLNTSNHVGRVRDLSVRIAEVVGLEREYVRVVGIAATLHDVGKISTPDAILSKPGPLTDQEYEVMKEHAANGANLLRHIKSLPEGVYGMVLHHHERWDGKGYPMGLEGNKIPLGAQIIAIADCYDAMTWDRPYRKGFEVGEALKRMELGCGTQFNSDLLCAFFAMSGYQPRTNELAIQRYPAVLARLQLDRPPTFDFAAMQQVPEIAAAKPSGRGETVSGQGLTPSAAKEKPRVLNIEPPRPRVLKIETE